MIPDQQPTSAGPPLAEEARYAAGTEAASHKKCNGTGRYPKREGRWVLFKFCRRCNGTGRVPMNQAQPHNALALSREGRRETPLEQLTLTHDKAL